jgi:MoaA/NifB/PqqE/SkfB family radical SAM enzyme
MPNILLTNQCDLKCPYCFAINEIVEQKPVGNNELSLKNFKIILDFLERSGDKKVRLMGGEPTLHSQFKEIIDYTLDRGFNVQVFTNGLFSSQIANFLAGKGVDIKYSFNINPPEMYSSKLWNRILRNLEKLSSFESSLIGAVIWQKDFRIDYLIDLTKKHPIKIIMLRIANPIVNQKNQYLTLDQYPALARNLIREIKKANRNKVRVGFGCGFSKRMFGKGQLAILKKYQVANLNWGCQGNSGRFDITPDLSVFRCFPLSNWQRKKLTDFEDSQSVENYFNSIMAKYQSENSKNDFISQGPCFSYLLSRNL